MKLDEYLLHFEKMEQTIAPRFRHNGLNTKFEENSQLTMDEVEGIDQCNGVVRKGNKRGMYGFLTPNAVDVSFFIDTFI